MKGTWVESQEEQDACWRDTDIADTTMEMDASMVLFGRTGDEKYLKLYTRHRTRLEGMGAFKNSGSSVNINYLTEITRRYVK